MPDQNSKKLTVSNITAHDTSHTCAKEKEMMRGFGNEHDAHRHWLVTGNQSAKNRGPKYNQTDMGSKKQDGRSKM